MSIIDYAAIQEALQIYHDPYLRQDLISAGCIKELSVDGNTVSLSVEFNYPVNDLKERIQQLLSTHIKGVPGVETVHVNVNWIVKSTHEKLTTFAGIKNIIAVASGKGGVGKSTTSVNLALALVAAGAKVGIMDADIYGPSVGIMLGFPNGTRPKIKNEKFFIPMKAYGIHAMSMAFLVTEDTPVIWRGPMVSSAIQQIFTQTLWNDLDYLFIDMPPGTGDIQLTLSQKIPITGSVIITTPQNLALIDAKKGIEMFNKVNIPVLGVVENMNEHICSKCGHTENLFDSGGGIRIADQFAIEFLGSLPLSMIICKQTDTGKPTVVSEPNSQISMIYKSIAKRLAAKLALKNLKKASVPVISFKDD